MSLAPLDIEEPLQDCDTCDIDEINRLFFPAVHRNEAIVDANNYVLHVSATREASPKIGVAMSDFTCSIYDFDKELYKLKTVKENDKVIDCIFSPDDPFLFFTGSSEGIINLWDLRSLEAPVMKFKDDTQQNKSKTKEFSCFDISPNNRLLAVGTNIYEGDAFILFWDVRKTKQLGGYWESHTDDITQVKFHSSDNNKLISGSTDGLINVYDLSQTQEEDALIESLNSLCPIEQLLWFNHQNKDKISCITSTTELQLWDIDGVEPYMRSTRDDFCREIKRSKGEYIYLTKTHRSLNGLFLLAGSNSNDGECLRSLQYLKSEWHPAINFNDNKQRVRASWYNEYIGFLITGGEKGSLDVWKIDL